MTRSEKISKLRTTVDVLASRITILEYELKRTKSEYDVALSEFNSEIGVRLQLQNAAAPNDIDTLQAENAKLKLELSQVAADRDAEKNLHDEWRSKAKKLKQLIKPFIDDIVKE